MQTISSTQNLKYIPTEKIRVNKTVHRLDFITDACRGKRVLDLGCFDETATIKENSGNYLFEEVSKVASLHIGVDNSKLIPAEGIYFKNGSKIILGSVYDLDKIEELKSYNFDVVIAGELIEHLPNTLDFFTSLKQLFPGKTLICSTPNTTSFSNMLLSHFSRESCHIDHLQVYSYKSLNTLCRLAAFENWTIIPYHVKFTEMIIAAKQPQKSLVKTAEKMVNVFEKIFPMTAGGYIVKIKL